MSSIKLKDLGAICRICLKLYKDGEFLFERKQSTSGLSLAEMLNYITFHKLEPSDTLPHFVCENCKRSVCSAYNLKQQYENSYKMLCDLVNDGKSLMLNSSTKELVEKSTQTERNGNKIIGCRCCSRTCKDFGFWKNHIEKVDSFTNIATNRKCHLCGREFSRFEHLRQHLAIIHKILIDSGKQAARKQNLKKDYSTKKAKGQQKLIKDEIQEQLSDGENECPLAELIDTSSSSKNDVTKDIRRDCLTTDDSSILSIKKDELKDSLVTQQPSNVIPGIFTTRKRGRGRPPKTIAINKCNFCNADLKNFATLMSHIQEKHVEIKKFSNTECSSKIDINSKHMVANLHKGVDQVSYSSKLHSCTKCLKSFTTKLYLKRHLEKHDKQRFICKECHENFPSRDELSIHVKAEGHDKPLLCPECGLRCKTSNILMIHIRRHKGEKPFKCKFCTKGFPRSDDLKVHERYHTGEKSHFCETCGKGFQRKYNLTIHMRVHTGEKPYKCPHCPQAFSQGNDLKAHIRRHTGERFRCEVCGSGFLQGYQIRQHKLQEHGICEIPPTQRVKKFMSAEEQQKQIQENLQKSTIKETV